jgi:ribosome-associated protein
MSSSRKTVDRQQVEAWAVTAARAADDKKGTDVLVLRVGDLLEITDAFVIVSATNDRQVRSIAEEVERQVKESGGPSPLRIEGLSEARWILMDYGDFVVHVFLDETREFYNLERLWSDAPRIEWQSDTTAINE